ncbi:MAG: hypothetical protein SGILL_005154, partial [Bacillariaceae sp.]
VAWESLVKSVKDSGKGIGKNSGEPEEMLVHLYPLGLWALYTVILFMIFSPFSDEPEFEGDFI